MNSVEGGKPLLTVSQVEALTGVGKSTIRHWEREFRDFLESERTSGNQRRFSKGAVQKIEKIKELVEDQGLTLRGVRRQLERTDTEVQTDQDLDPTVFGENVDELSELLSDHIMRQLFKDD